ncbi:MAG: DUF948 domain-containing protein [Salinibacterium sp.]|nr:DUF948 domain-containing protein [Salinibacterium sp.]
MTGGDIAGLIAAGVFAILVGLLAVPLIKLGRVFDEASTAIRGVSEGIAPLFEEATTTISETNKQIARVDSITSSVDEATKNLAAVVALFSASVGRPLIRIAAFSAGVRAAIRGGKPAASAKSATKRHRQPIA